jgi:hypothetical protein
MPKAVDTLMQALALIDAANAEDPNSDRDGTEMVPKELLYGRRMSEMLARFAPASADAIKLAVRAQHVQRWKIPRSDFPMTKPGYFQWRTGLYRFHAETAARLLTEAGCDEAIVARAAAAIDKKNLRDNPDTQLVEDVAALVFIEHYMTGFAAQKPDYDEAKWLLIIRKTWKKMSDAARAFALSGALCLPADLLPLISKAITEEPV